MYKRIQVLCFLLLGTIAYSQSGSAILWQKCLGGTGNENGNDEQPSSSIIETFDRGLVAVCSTYSSDGDITGYHNNGDAWVVKLTSSGDMEWQKCLGGTGVDRICSLIQMPDSSFVGAGYTFSTDGDVVGYHGGNFTDGWVVKLSSTGELEWQKCMGGTSIDRLNCITPMSDSEYVLAGLAASTDGDLTGQTVSGGYDVWVIKMNMRGQLLWQKTFGGTGTEMAHAIIRTVDGGVAIAARTTSINGDASDSHGYEDAWIIKLTSDGEVEWKKCFGGSKAEVAYSLTQTSDTGYVFVGYTSSNDGDVTTAYGDFDAWVVKLDPRGVLQWQKSLGGYGSDVAESVIGNDSGKLVIAVSTGTTNISGHHGGYSDIWIAQLSNTGNTEWARCYGGSGTEYTKSIIPILDSGFALAALTSSVNGDVTGNHGGTDLWIVRMGEIPARVESALTANTTALGNYPNPFKESTTLAYTLKRSATVSVEIINQLGTTVKKINSRNELAGDHALEIDLSDSPAGSYYCIIRVNGRYDAHLPIVHQ